MRREALSFISSSFVANLLSTRGFISFVAVRASFLLGVWHPLARHKRTIRESILRENHIFHQFTKVFLLENFPLYGIYVISTCASRINEFQY